jgi:hypothetical protein
MLMEILAGLEGSALAAGLRGSKWVYPLVNAGHIAGIALLFGAIAGFDLRLMGAWPRVPLKALAKVLVPIAGTGLCLAAGFGSLLFIVKATEYATSSLFQAKMVMLTIALANLLAYRLLSRRLVWPDGGGGDLATAMLQRLCGAVSLAAWLSVLILGRLVGYF